MAAIFFYGLFMDISMLQEKGLSPSNPVMARAQGFGLRIGERATLVKAEGECAYGVVMPLSGEDVSSLYSESSVADYVSEQIDVIDGNDRSLQATVYNLPPDLLSGRNTSYAQALAIVARKVGLPVDYIKEIERWAE